MARVFTNGFEAGDFTTDGWFIYEGSPSYITSGQRTGARGLEINSFVESLLYNMAWNSVDGRHHFYRAAFKVVTEPSGLSTFMSFWTAAQASVARMRYDPATNTIQMWDTTAQRGSSSAAITVGDWNIVELRLMVNTAGTDYIEARLNGTVFATDSGSDRFSTLPGYLTLTHGGSGTPGVWRFDDVAYNDDTGAGDNSWPGTPVAPTTTLTGTPTNPSTVTTPTFTFTGGTTEGGPTFEGRLDGGSYSTITSPYTTPTLATGSHTFDVRAVDLLGQVDATPASFTWTLNAPGSTASFPTTALRDDFNRADESPVSQGGNWQGPVNTADYINMKVTGNQLALAGPDAATYTFGSAVYNVNLSDGEVYTTVATWEDHLIRLYIRVKETGAANTYDGYMLDMSSGSWILYKVTDGLPVQLGATGTQALNPGDSVGLEAIGTNINIYYKPATGSWSQIGTRADSTYSSGKIGIGTNSPIIRFDNFGGGPIVSTVTGGIGGPSSLLDQFTRADGSLGANWTGQTGKWAINTNRIGLVTPTIPNDIYWIDTFSSNAEVYADIPVRDVGWYTHLLAKLPDGSGYRAVILNDTSTQDKISLYRHDGSNVVTINANNVVSSHAGYVLSVNSDGKVNVYGKSGGGVRTSIISVSENTHRGQFKIGVESSSSTIRLDNFGGGIVTTTPVVESTTRKNKILISGTWVSKPVMVLVNGVWVEKPDIVITNASPPPSPPPGSTPTAVPGIPTGLAGIGTSNSVTLTWNANPAADAVDSYQIYRNDVMIASNINTLGFTDTGLSGGTTYNYRVSAHNALGYGTWSSAVGVATTGAAPPPTPLGDPVAKFHRLAIHGTITTPATTSASRDTFHICQGFWDTARRDQIKAINPNCKVLCYINYTRIYNGPYDSNSIFTVAERPQYNTGVVDPDAGGNVMKIDYPGIGQDIINTLTAKFGSTTWDGLMLDDLNHTGDGYLTDTQWRTAQENLNSVVGPGLKANMPTKLFIPNMTGDAGQHNYETGGWVERQFNYFDGGLDEFTYQWPGGNARSQVYMDASFQLLGAIAAKGKYYLSDSVGSESQALFGLCCTLLQTTGGITFYATDASSNYGLELWYPNVHDKGRALGKALAAKYVIGSNTWRRDFEHGYVTANLTSRVGTITVV